MVREKLGVKKRWFSLVSTPEFNSTHLGESRAYSPQDLVGRTLVINLMTLTNDPRKQSFNATFVVNKVEGDQGVAQLISYDMGGAYVRRVVRKGTTRVDDTFMVLTKDNTFLLVKPLLITKYKADHSITTLLRRKMRTLVASRFAVLSTADAFSSVIGNNLQMDIKKSLKKIYPLTTSEIRVLEVVPQRRLQLLSPLLLVTPPPESPKDGTEEDTQDADEEGVQEQVSQPTTTNEKVEEAPAHAAQEKKPVKAKKAQKQKTTEDAASSS